MISVYPYASGSLYTASYAISASYANSAQYIQYVSTASFAQTVLYPLSGSRGKSVCLLSEAQFNYLYASNLMETCKIPSSYE